MATTNGHPSGVKGKVLSPSHMAHVVLRTGNFEKQKAFYTAFLGGHVVFENDIIAFITYDDEHHRIALLNVPELQHADYGTSGLEHIAFTFDSLKDLCDSYKQRKALGLVPGWCVNHGPTTSMYYRDYDGNQVEVQVDNFDTAEEATASMMSPQFAHNTFGSDYDPEELCAAVERGVPEKELKVRKDVGPRDRHDLHVIMEKLRGTMPNLKI